VKKSLRHSRRRVIWANLSCLISYVLLTKPRWYPSPFYVVALTDYQSKLGNAAFCGDFHTEMLKGGKNPRARGNFSPMAQPPEPHVAYKATNFPPWRSHHKIGIGHKVLIELEFLRHAPCGYWQIVALARAYKSSCHTVSALHLLNHRPEITTWGNISRSRPGSLAHHRKSGRL